MKISTKKSLIGKVFDFSGLNESFHKYENIQFDKKAQVISPVEARVSNIGKISENGNIISKNNKTVFLKDLLGQYSHEFIGGTYINFYLNPGNKHFWVTPSEGKFIYTQKNEGKS